MPRSSIPKHTPITSPSSEGLFVVDHHQPKGALMPHRLSLRFCIQNSRIRRLPLRQARCGFVYGNPSYAGKSETHLGKEAACRPSIASSRRKRSGHIFSESEVVNG